MRYGSVCSGIEAATMAWHPLGWQPAWFSEIEPFPSAVLAHHYPDIPNLGDMTKLHDNPTFTDRPIDLLVGGTPCQSFSQAGKRLGLDDPRGNLALEFLRLAKIKQPRWLVWENVPGVLSHDGGRTLGIILGTLGELGYGFAYRVLNAQNFGVPQRRRRVFVVGYHGDWRRAAAVLFERETASASPKADAGALQEQADAGRSWWNGRQLSETLQAGGMGQSMPNKQHFQAVLDEEGGKPLLRWLTEIECERLQGFPDDFTQIPWKKKTRDECPKGPRYKAVGNSMAVPVMNWIGRRIEMVDAL